MKNFEINLSSLISIRNKIVRRKSYFPSLLMLRKNVVIQSMRPMPALRIILYRKYLREIIYKIIMHAYCF